jgi:FkbM family methyltransferase
MNSPTSPAVTRKLELAADPFSKLSYSQFGEDLLVEVMLRKIENGIYVDIGAHHPRRISNTHLLNLKGWSGINVDLDPKLIERFLTERPKDISLVAALSDKEEVVRVRLFNEGAVNTISDAAVEAYKNQWAIREEFEISSTTLKSLLDGHLPPGKRVNFLNVDVEGVDLKVLRGNDWNTYRPELVVVEIQGLDLRRLLESDIVRFMADVGYKMVGYMHISAFFAPS